MIWNRLFFKAGMNCDVGFWRAKHPSSCAYFDKTNSALTCSLFPPIFNAYSRNICARLVGDLASWSLWPSLKSPACLKEPRRVFVPRSWLTDWRTSEPGGRVEKHGSSSKTKHPSWLTAHLPKFDVCQYWKLELLSRLLLFSWNKLAPILRSKNFWDIP